MRDDLKPIAWVGTALEDVRRFPEAVRREAGHQLMRVQQGLMPSDSKPMPGVGAGAHEIRIHANGEHRVFYVAKFMEAVYVLHGFEKKSRKTMRADLEAGRARYAQVLAFRRNQRK